MSVQLSSVIAEFQTEEQAASYESWFKAKVENAMDDPRPGIAHEQVMAEMDAIIAEAEARTRIQG